MAEGKSRIFLNGEKKAFNELRLTAKRNWLKSLLLECPFGRPLADCPFMKHRGRPMRERELHADSIPQHLVEENLLHHKNCILFREGLNLKDRRYSCQSHQALFEHGIYGAAKGRIDIARTRDSFRSD